MREIRGTTLPTTVLRAYLENVVRNQIEVIFFVLWRAVKAGLEEHQ